MQSLTSEGLTIQEVAKATGKDPKTVWKWIKGGLLLGCGRLRLKASKIGREWRIDPADLDEFSRQLTESALAK